MAAPNSTTTAHYLYDGDSSDGIIIGGSATKKVGFFGTTPAVQQTAPAVVTTATLVTTSVTGTFGFVTTAQGDAVVTIVGDLRTQVNAIRTALVNLGLAA